MLAYDWFATAYGWPPDVVDNLTVAQDYWLPIVREARAEAGKIIAAQEKK